MQAFEPPVLTLSLARKGNQEPTTAFELVSSTCLLLYMRACLKAIQELHLLLLLLCKCAVVQYPCSGDGDGVDGRWQFQRQCEAPAACGFPLFGC